jgi:signal transduction histidine kinase
MEFSANEKKVALLFDPSEPLPIQGDSSKLSQVFNNLLANAIKFTPAQGKVTVSTVMNDDQTVTINVVDTGPGIPAEARKMVFDKFEQLKTYQKGVEPGSGLGLTICKNIVDLHGGTITVTSAPGDGSTFTVTLPLVRPSNLNDSGVLVLNRITAK